MLLEKHIVKEKGIDNTISLIKDGYLFIKNRTDKYETNLFETHLMGQKVLCMTGKDAARLFYNSELFQRNGATPKRVQKTIFGENAIQTMDGEAHLHRKNLFMSLVTFEEQKRLAQLLKGRWEASIGKWERSREIVLFDEAKDVLCQVACDFAGVPLRESEIMDRAEDFSSMVDGFEAIGPRYWKGKMARARTEEWIGEIIEDVRCGRLNAKEGTALHAMAFFKELDGSYMDIQMAAKELINVVRPIVAVAIYVTFEALALYEHPEYKGKLRFGDASYLEMFAQEVRRFYPFTPFIGAKAKKDFILNGYEIKKGMLIFLDMYGTNHDPHIWENPNEFNPDRFKEWKGSLYGFIPQGGGNPYKTHRCPGDGITVEIMKTTLDFLVNKIEYKVPKQDLSYSLSRMPSLPESEFVMKDIRKRF